MERKRNAAMAAAEPMAAANPFGDDEQFDAKAREIAPEAYQAGDSKFVNLSKLASMFIIMPRKEKPESFYLPTLLHHGLTQRNEAGEAKRTARICLEAAGLGKCAACYVLDKLRQSKRPEDVNAAKALSPKKRVLMTVWWIPLSPVIGQATSKFVFPMVTYDGRRATYEVLEAPQMKVLGLPTGTWENLKIMLQMSGTDRFVGEKGYPIFVLGNGVDGIGRRYKEPKTWDGQFYDELRPTDTTPLIDLYEAADVPTAEDVAAIVGTNYPGLITGFNEN